MTAKANRFFNPRLYLDGLKQLRLIGIVAFVILELEAVLVPLGHYITIRQNPNYYLSFDMPTGYVISTSTIGFTEMHPLLVLCFVLFAPIMVLYLYSFLNKRSSSDFYHSLPCSRVCLYLSFMAAVITWIAAIILISSATSLLGFALLHEYFTINLTSVWTMLFNTFAACLYVSAAVSLAMCLSGTLFTNLVVSFLLLFMPRILITIFTTSLSNAVHILSSDHFLPPLDSKYNIVTNLVFGVFTGRSSETFTYLPGGVYTLCLGLVFTALAAWAFHRRKSEAAGQSAPNRALQMVYRVLLGLIVCLYPCMAIFEAIIHGTRLDGDDLFEYAVLYIAAIVVCFVYELITTRKWRNLVRVLPSLGVLAVLNVLIIGGLAGGYYSALSFHPDAEDIIYVRMVDKGNNYFGAQLGTIELDDPVIRETVANRLQDHTDRLRKNPNSNFYDYYEQLQTVAIHTRGRTVYRRLAFTTADQRHIWEQLMQNEKVQRLYTTLPQLGSNATSVRVGNLSSSQAEEVYASFQREMEAMNFHDWYAYVRRYNRSNDCYINTEDDTEEKYSFATLYVATGIGSDQRTLYLPLTEDFPETTNLYMNMCNGGNAVQRATDLLTRDWLPQDTLTLTLTKQPSWKESSASWYSSTLMTMETEINNFLKAIADAPTQADVHRELVVLDVNGSKTYINPPVGTDADILLRILQGNAFILEYT